MTPLYLLLLACFIPGLLAQANPCVGDVTKDLAGALAKFKCNKFLQAIGDANAVDGVSGSWTIFAPTDDAWDAFLADNKIPNDVKKRNARQTAVVTALVRAHIVGNNKVEVRYSQNGQPMTLQTLLKDTSTICGKAAVPGQGSQLIFTAVTGGFTNTGKAVGKAVATITSTGGVKATTIAADQEVSCLGGFALHVVPSVLSPCKTLAVPDVSTCAGTLSTALTGAAGQLSAAALLQKALPAGFTGAVFVPTNDALDAVSTGLATYLKTALTTPLQLTNGGKELLTSTAMVDILAYHLVPGADLGSATAQAGADTLITALSPTTQKLCKTPPVGAAPLGTLDFTQATTTTGSVTDGAGQAAQVPKITPVCNGTLMTVDTVLLPCTWANSNILDILGVAEPVAPLSPPPVVPSVPATTPTPTPAPLPVAGAVILVPSPSTVDPTIQIPGQEQPTYQGPVVIPGVAGNGTRPEQQRVLPPAGSPPSATLKASSGATGLARGLWVAAAAIVGAGML